VHPLAVDAIFGVDGVALLAWAALVAPGIVEMHRAFQNVEPEES
jgi:hypothetical protein